jgi:hypothetical protein
MKWAGVIGAFFSLHAFIKKRTLRAALRAWGFGTSLSGFPIWSFFMTRHNYFQNTITGYEAD